MPAQRERHEMGDTATIGGGDPYVLVVAQLVEGVRLAQRGRSHAVRLKPQAASKSTADPRGAPGHASRLPRAPGRCFRARPGASPVPCSAPRGRARRAGASASSRRCGPSPAAAGGGGGGGGGGAGGRGLW